MLDKAFRGSSKYWTLLAFWGVIICGGLAAFGQQLTRGLAITGMSRDVSWGLYISQFTFLVGVAASAVMVVLPYYLHNYKQFRRMVILGEFLAVSAVVMCPLFILVDLGQPQRVLNVFLHPTPNSMMFWDTIVLIGYLLLNLIIGLVTFDAERKGAPPSGWVKPLIYLSIPWAVSIHTVTAFLYNGLSSRPFWNASILAPRFLASAFCSGPAIMLILFQIIRNREDVEIDNKAIFKIAELIAYAMAINLFLLGAEMFKEFYSGGVDSYSIQYLYFGLHGKSGIVPWIWTATLFNITAFFIFLFPKTRENFTILNIGCVLIIIGVYIEKGMGLIVPGFIPDALGEIYEYSPTTSEIIITMGIWAIGALIYTLLLKFAVPIYTGKLRFETKER
jgi:Ni/Fe-hydrogenase subunit HybB-like protein